MDVPLEAKHPPQPVSREGQEGSGHNGQCSDKSQRHVEGRPAGFPIHLYEVPRGHSVEVLVALSGKPHHLLEGLLEMAVIQVLPSPLPGTLHFGQQGLVLPPHARGGRDLSEVLVGEGQDSVDEVPVNGDELGVDPSG